MKKKAQREFISQLCGNIVPYVEVSSLLAKRALDENNEYQKGLEKAAAVAPQVLDKMLKMAAIRPDQKQAAANLLATPEGTMTLLNSALDKWAEVIGKTQKVATDLGKGVDEKRAGVIHSTSGPDYDSLTDPMVGRKTTQKKASDKPLLALIGR